MEVDRLHLNDKVQFRVMSVFHSFNVFNFAILWIGREFVSNPVNTFKENMNNKKS